MPSAGILLALASALVWGSGDFVGGAATRRSHPFQVLALSAMSGVVVLAALALLRETSPPAASLAWAASAGLAGAIGIASLYQGLAVGGAAVVAPIAAVVTAIIPIIFTAVTVAPPVASQVGGFVAALAGIWLVTYAPGTPKTSRTGLELGLLAGVGFGVFLVLIAHVERDFVFAPLAVARSVMLATAVVLMRFRSVAFPSPGSNLLALLAGVLDAGGNVLFVLARQHTRLDVAAVLSSLYPVATVVLARVLWREPVTRLQWAGIGVCLLSVALMAA